MAGRVEVVSAIPGATSLEPIIRGFCRKPEGVVTAFSDALLPVCRAHVDDDCLVEVLSFDELVKRCLAMAGEEALPVAPSGHFEAAVAHACRDLPEGSPFRRTARFAGFHKACARTLKELLAWGVEPSAMAEASRAASPRLAAKLASLAQIGGEVERVLGLLGRQTHAAHLTASLQGVPERDGALDRLLVFAGAEEYPLRVRWLQWLAASGVEVTVVTDRHATGGDVFRGARRTEALLGVPPREIGPTNRLLLNLFGTPGDGPEIDVAIASAADPLAEVEWALRGALQAERPDRVGLYVRDLESYAPLVETAAKRLGVPVVVARREPLLANAFARLTLTALEFCASHDVRTLGPIVPSSYLDLSAAAQTRLVGGLRQAHRMRGLQWEALRTWAEEHEDEFPWLLKLLIWRHEKASTPATPAEWTSRLIEMMSLLPWHETASGTPSATQRRDSYAQSALQRTLFAHASVDRVTDGGVVPLEKFVLHCRTLWSAGDVSVPRAEFGVTVTASAEGLGDLDTLYVLGMLEGVFPRRRSEDPILTDEERRELNRLRPGEPPLQTSHEVAAQERDEFYRVCASARKALVFSYPQADDQRDNVPAFYLSAVEEAVGKVSKLDYPRTLLAPGVEACLSEADRRLREALDGPREMPSPVEIVSEKAKAAIRPPDDQPFTPGQLRDALQCSFQYVARHRLKLRAKRPAARWATLRSLPQASGLMRQPGTAEAEAALIAALEDRLEELYSEIPEWEMQLLRAGGVRLIREWIRREFGARTAWPKDDVSSNVGFGSNGLRDKMPGGVRLEGVVPGVSTLDRYKVTHLFGSGVKEGADLTDTEKLYYGLYFLAMHDGEHEGALEVESMGGRRTLMVLTRAGRPLASRVQEGLHVVDLSTADDPALSKRLFYEDVKRALARAVANVREPRIEANKGDHCDWCDYGELCRRAKGYGEEDSPFGLDAVFEE